jgi:hypothetical protein
MRIFEQGAKARDDKDTKIMRLSGQIDKLQNALLKMKLQLAGRPVGEADYQQSDTRGKSLRTLTEAGESAVSVEPNIQGD